MKLNMRIPPLHRSLVGQTTLLSGALLVLAVTLLVLLPLLSMERTDPLQRTLYLATAAAAGVQDNAEAPLSSILQDPDIANIMAANRRFRLYLRRGAEEFQIGAPPRWTEAFDSPGFRSGEGGGQASGSASSFARFEFSEGNARGMASLLQSEDRDHFIEAGGIDAPVEPVRGFLADLSPAFFWSWFRDYLVVGGTMLAGVLFLLFLLIRSLRRLARVAQSLDPQAPSHRLPEKGLPIEILPMVRAINQMIARMDKANEEQAFFLAAAAHELRTPLAVLRARLESLPDGASKDELKQDLRRMSGLVDQLLRLMSVRNKPAPSSTVDLVSVAKEVVAERAPLVIKKGVQIDLDTEERSSPVRGDKRLLAVALANLVDNALSFSESGQTLRVKVGRERNITVFDQGPGVPSAELESIFHPFSKNPPNRRGNGLGLAITRAIMALHGGSVSAANRKSGGARFALQF